MHPFRSQSILYEAFLDKVRPMAWCKFEVGRLDISPTYRDITRYHRPACAKFLNLTITLALLFWGQETCKYPRNM